ncbi:YAR1 [Candida jiufengensis]|uniref:YAR1 n=1 Tax=Candida jiufengensis TaxID=497108 RepID=UPI0022253B47|nr:YAR1 [Candida jiufengensis]KAI5950334.1 YAR1 [Candida jiufengensis]
MSSSDIVDKLTQEEMDVIIYDARVGDLETLQEIFEEIPKDLILNIKDDITLSTPIHMASANGHIETVKYLLSIISNKKDAINLVKQKNETGNTALHWASYNGHLPIVQYLVEEYEADAFDKNNVGHDSIYEAENNNQTEVENWFLKKYTPEEDFKIEENDDGTNTKITYTPGKESKLADDNAKEAVFKSSLNNKEKKDDVEEAKENGKSLEEKTSDLLI